MENIFIRGTTWYMNISDEFFFNRPIPKCKKLIKQMFLEPELNRDTVMDLYNYLSSIANSRITGQKMKDRMNVLVAFMKPLKERYYG